MVTHKNICLKVSNSRDETTLLTKKSGCIGNENFAIIISCIAGIFSSDKMFTGLADVECSLMKSDLLHYKFVLKNLCLSSKNELIFHHHRYRLDDKV